ncbi:MAG: hypothetical protein FWC92_06695 [Defluviitaleaceae bacterium]|nr:hypothetical protein [Defluviitaleaceae bacterium]
MSEETGIILDILSFLCDDDETLEIIAGILDNKDGELRGIYTPQNVLPIILKLIEKGKVCAGIPKQTTDMLSYEWCRVDKVNMNQIDEYWFRITDEGREFFVDASN